MISIHALRGEGDIFVFASAFKSIDFNPRPPWGGRYASFTAVLFPNYFNPRPPWGGR